MRVGRVGVFTAPNGAIGLAAVAALLGNDALVAKTTDGALVKFTRGQIHILDSCGSNSNAADLVRNVTGISVGGRELSGGQLEGVIALENYGGGSTAAPATVSAVSGDEVHLSPTILQAIRQVVKSIIHKKKPQPVQFVRASRSTSKSNTSKNRKSTSTRSRSARAKKSTAKGNGSRSSSKAAVSDNQ